MTTKGRAPDPAEVAVLRETIADCLVRGSDPADGVRCRLPELSPGAGAAVAHLAARDDDEEVREAARWTLLELLDDTAAEHADRERLAAEAGAILEAALVDPAVHDTSKLGLLPFLSACGIDMSREDLLGCLEDPRRAAIAASQRIFGRMPHFTEALEDQLAHVGLGDHVIDGPEVTDELLTTFHDLMEAGLEVCPELAAATLVTGAAIVQTNGRAARWCADCLRMAARARCGRSLWFLREFGRLPGTRLLGELARTLARRLEREGVTADPPPVGRFEQAMVSNVDGSGARSVFLVHAPPRGPGWEAARNEAEAGAPESAGPAAPEEDGADAAVFFLREDRGIEECFGVYGTASRVARRYVEDDLMVHWSPCDLETVREILGDALAVHEERGVAPPGRFLIGRAFLGEGPLPARRREAELGAYRLHRLQLGPELVEGSEALLEHPVYGGLYFTSDALYDFIRERLPASEREQQDFTLSPADFDTFVGCVPERERRGLLKKMALNLEIEALGGRHRRRVHRLAAKTWLALDRGVVPFEQVPYVRGLCAEAHDSILVNLRCGFRNQEEANRALREYEARRRRLGEGSEAGPPR